MIGKIYISVVDYYDIKTSCTKRKQRPVLIISGPHNNDYTVLPISTISKSENIDPLYDIEVIPDQYPLLGLKRRSFLRTHKQTPIHKASLVREIGDIKANYPDLYMDVLAKWEQFHLEICDSVL